MSFSKDRKIHTKAQYSAVFAKRNKLKAKFFNIYWKENLEPNSMARVGVSVAKRNISLAVKRNKFKRLVKENFRLNSKILPPVDIVVVVKQEALSLKSNHCFFNELDKKWEQLIQLVPQQISA